MLSGHTHGGQICLPGSIPIKLEAVLPRRMGAGAWKYHNMTGYRHTLRRENDDASRYRDDSRRNGSSCPIVRMLGAAWVFFGISGLSIKLA
jgi:hypothetical protein